MLDDFSSQTIFVGVDGGGTKTRVILINSFGKVLGFHEGGASSYLEDGYKAVEESLKSLFAPFSAILKYEKTISCFGLPNVGEFENSEQILGELVKKTIGIHPTLVVNDVVVGWAGGTFCTDGVHIVAGTGAIVYGRKGDYEVRVSGWGSLIGDEGSAYDIGRETLRRLTRQIDGREKVTFLRDFLFSSLKLSNDYELIRWAFGADRRKKIASIAALTYEAALKGDEVALEILEKAAYELFLAASTGVKRLGLERPLISYSGSVLEKNEIVKKRFESYLKESFPNVLVRQAPLNPVLGAVLLAYKTAFGKVDEGFVKRLFKVQENLFGR